MSLPVLRRFGVSVACALSLTLGLAPPLGAQAVVASEPAAPAASQRVGPDNADAVVKRVLELGRSDSRVQAHLHTLVNEIGPRLTSSRNLERAELWCRNQFAEWGLEARLEQWGQWPVGFDRLGMSGRMLMPETEELVFTTRSWTPGTDGPTRGRALLCPKDLAELEARREELRGAWILARPRGDRGAADAREEVDAELDALGILGEVRGARDAELVLTSGDHEVDWEALPRRTSILLQGAQFDALQQRLAEGQEVVLEFDVQSRFRQGPIALHNVIADIPGTEFPDEIVLVGGHLDSWDGATGTCDNGTGVATTLEAARLLSLAGARPRRTIRFALWSGEEQGLFGSSAYVKRHQRLLDRISAVLIHDGGTNYLSSIAGPAAMFAQLEHCFAPLTDLNPEMPFEVIQNKGLSRQEGSSDHAPFVRAGVPGFFWGQKGRADYNFVHHTQHDTFDQAIPEYQQHSALVVAIGAYNLANLDAQLDRTKLYRPDPFRRRLGVELEDNRVTAVAESGKAAEAGWRADDVIVSIDGEAVATRRDVARQLAAGGPKKVIRVQRGEEEFETELDYTAEEEQHRREQGT